MIDTFGTHRINNLRVIKTGWAHPVYRLVRQNLSWFYFGRFLLEAREQESAIHRECLAGNVGTLLRGEQQR